MSITTSDVPRKILKFPFLCCSPVRGALFNQHAFAKPSSHFDLLSEPTFPALFFSRDKKSLIICLDGIFCLPL